MFPQNCVTFAHYTVKKSKGMPPFRNKAVTSQGLCHIISRQLYDRKNCLFNEFSCKAILVTIVSMFQNVIPIFTKKE
jgi:hypothetical protein